MNINEFANTITEQFYTDLHQQQQDNYDPYRFSYDGVDRSSQFNLGRHTNFFRFFFSNIGAFHSVHSLLADDYSKSLFVNLIRYKLAGHLHVRIGNSSWQSELKLFESLKPLKRTPSELGSLSLFGPLIHFDGLAYNDLPIPIDALEGSLVATFLKLQYSYRGGRSIRPEEGNVIIDGGGCLGDTAVTFALMAGKTGHVYCFDPVPVHQRAIRFNAAQNGLQERIECVPFALDQVTDVLSAELVESPRMGALENVIQPGFQVSGSNCPISRIAIDDFVEERQLKSVDFIKMDIEGAELAALKGAAKTICRFRPALAISLYHRPDDFVAIPQFLLSTCPEYQFYLDHYTIHEEETVLFAVSR